MTTAWQFLQSLDPPFTGTAWNFLNEKSTVTTGTAWERFLGLSTATGQVTANQLATAIRTELTPELAMIDAPISTRLSEINYVEPDNNAIANIPSAIRTELTPELSLLDAAISSRLAGSVYIQPDNTSITAIKAKTDSLSFNVNNDIKATLDGESVSVGNKTGFSLTTDYDAAKNAASQVSVDNIVVDVTVPTADEIADKVWRYVR